MTENELDTGVFLFTLDTELAWGHFDQFRPEMFSPDGERERTAIRRILDLLDEYNIAATWALVGHLFYDQCEQCQICPVLAWQGKYASYVEIREKNAPLWYAGSLMRELLSRSSRHEIGFHGYTHRIFDRQLGEEEARLEISEWLRVSSSRNVPAPRAVVFPRNCVGYLPVFEQAGFRCYRGDEILPPDYYSLPFLGKVFNRIDLILQMRTPQVYALPARTSGMVNLPASRGLFRIHPAFDRLLQAVGLGRLPARRLVQGVEKAAREKKIVHFYAHPYEFKREQDFEKLRQLLAAVAEHQKRGDLRSMTMSALAELSRAAS